MKTFSDKLNEEFVSAPNHLDQIRKGMKIEKEHTDVYNFLKRYLDENSLDMPFSEYEFYKMIAQAHLREMPDYYDRLEKMEKESE